MADLLYLSALRTQSLPFRIEEFVGFRAVTIAKQTIVEAIRQEAQAKHMPSRYYDNIHAELDGDELWVWVEFKGPQGERLDLFFEEGTKDHKIKPRNKKALAFLKRGAIGVATAVTAFSKGHWVSGIAARHVFEEGAKKGYPEFKRQLAREIEDHMRETMIFG